MSHKPIRFLKKITAALLFGAFLSFGCASIAPAEEKEQPTLPDINNQIAALKESFTGLYWNLWVQHNLSARLYACTVEAVNNYSGWFTAFANENDYVKAQNEINYSLSSEFNDLLRELQEQFGVILSLHVMTYYRDMFEILLENADDPELRAKFGEGEGLLRGTNPELRDEAGRASRENEVKFGETTNIAKTGNKVFKKVTGIDPVSSVAKMGVSAFEKIPGADSVTDFAKAGASAFKKLTGLDLGLGANLGIDSFSATGIAKAGLNVVEGIVGPGLTNSLSFVADKATQVLGAMGVLSLFGVESAAALVNPVMTLYSAYRASMTAIKLASGAENMRNGLYDPLHRYYLYSMPGDLWRQMDKPVREALQGFFAQVIRESIDAAEQQN